MNYTYYTCHLFLAITIRYVQLYCFLIRDRREELGKLTAEKRKEISVKEAGTHSQFRPSAAFRKEKALKIYTHNEESGASGTDATEQPSELD